MPQDGNGDPSTDGEMRAGDRAYEAQRFADAVRHYAQAVAVDGRRADGWHHLANARWRNGDRDGAISAYERAVKEDAGKARAWHNLATAYLAASRFREAAEAATKSVGLEPKRAKAWNNLAAARHGMNDFVGAETALRRALETDPEFATAWANLGRLLLDVKKAAPAAAALQKAMALGETEPAVRLSLARALSRAGDGAGAEATLADGVRAAPGAIDLWLALGDERLSHGNAEGALAAYEGASAAAADMGDSVRHDAARRVRLAALGVARHAVVAGERPLLLSCLDHLRDAAADDAQAGVAPPSAAGDRARGDPVVDAAVRDVVQAAERAGRADMSPLWVAQVVGSAARGGRAAPPTGIGA